MALRMQVTRSSPGRGLCMVCICELHLRRGSITAASLLVCWVSQERREYSMPTATASVSQERGCVVFGNVWLLSGCCTIQEKINTSAVSMDP